MPNSKDHHPISEIRLHGQPIDPATTGPFGVTEKEVQHILMLMLRQSANCRCPQMTLFRKLLRHFHIGPRTKARQQLLTNFLENIKHLKGQNRISFTSGKTKLYIVLTETPI
ncbi:MAG: hypothetical protein JXN61_07685 [Sedimentisphaerales bacterium]|nr:hypothetical protein [Sedimentisphaerales bacterium]